MARRKQQNPRHLETSQELATSMQNGIASGSDSEEDEHVCGRCRAEFLTLSDFIKHKTLCVSKRPVLVFSEGSKNDDQDGSLSNEDEEDALRTDYLQDKRFAVSLSDLPQLVQQLSDTNVTLEHLRNTTVAVAQHGRGLVELQLATALSKLHSQQLEQLQAIQELRSQILGVPTSPKSVPLVGTAALTPPQSGSESAMGVPAPNGTQPSAPTPARTTAMLGAILSEENYEPNTLKLLEKHTEQALQNSMSGGTFLLSSTGDFTGIKRSKDGKIDEVGSKHACRFCGKVFGSDSGLQIHLRSHTGERPFKCSVCNSCFSTKGNLKVHFQRHKERMEIPNDFHNGNVVNGDSNVDESNRCNEKATDFSSDKNSPCLPGHSNGQSGSDTPNDVSTLSDDSDDGSENCDNELTINEHHFDDEDDHDSDASGLNDSTPEGDIDNIMGMRQIAFSTPTFTPFFRPTSFSGTLSESPLCLPHPTTTGSGGENAVYHRDPSVYQDLLPRVGSADSSWESLMEVTETSETTKLQKLVDNIEVADPNQCIICHRVLSCRSALQMHYRTHTGERPFKCKICGRAFTTKGNLKTHMSVHRHKAPSRMLHQCPVCHKQFANSAMLQQHIHMHTAVRGVVLPDAAMYFPENKNSTLLPPSYPRPLLMPPSSEPLALTNSDVREKLDNSESVIKSTNNIESQRSAVSSPIGSSSDSESPDGQAEEAASSEDIKPLCMDLVVKTLEPEGPKPLLSESSPAVNLTSSHARSTPLNGEKENLGTYDKLSSPISKSENKFSPVSENAINMSSPSNNSPDANSIKDKLGRSPLSMMLHLPTDKPLPMTLPNDCPIPLSLQPERHIFSMSVPSSTSELTASLTALENHVKAINSSTTNPLPFPPPLGMGFMPNYFRQDFGMPYHNKEKTRTYSPPNSKNSSDVSADENSGTGLKSESPNARSESGALDLTPRGNSFATNRPVSDLKALTPLAGLPFPPPHTRPGTTCQLCFKTFACQSALEIHYRSHTKERPFKCDVCDRGFSTKGNMKQHMLTHKIRDLPPQLFTSCSQVTTSNSTTMITSPIVSQNSSLDLVKKLDDIAKRPLVDVNHNPSPKRSSGIPKHVCEVCHKPFSSGSALQIHMRTHTGIKPFQCNICSRAFTTKGNLKVHMGTHLSNNGASRRGRRMSLDIAPMALPLGKPGEYPPRHDMFFPYLPPFLNGLAQNQIKMNEISVIQSAVSRDDVMAAVSMSMAPPSFVSSMRPLALVTSPSEKQEVKRPNDESRHGTRDQCSPGRPMLPSNTPPVSVASWPWKMTCGTCSKICSSSVELEMHINKEHPMNEPQPLVVDKNKVVVSVENKT